MSGAAPSSDGCCRSKTRATRWRRCVDGTWCSRRRSRCASRSRSPSRQHAPWRDRAQRLAARPVQMVRGIRGPHRAIVSVRIDPHRVPRFRAHRHIQPMGARVAFRDARMVNAVAGVRGSPAMQRMRDDGPRCAGAPRTRRPPYRPHRKRASRASPRARSGVSCRSRRPIVVARGELDREHAIGTVVVGRACSAPWNLVPPPWDTAAIPYRRKSYYGTSACTRMLPNRGRFWRGSHPQGSSALPAAPSAAMPSTARAASSAHASPASEHSITRRTPARDHDGRGG